MAKAESETPAQILQRSFIIDADNNDFNKLRNRHRRAKEFLESNNDHLLRNFYSWLWTDHSETNSCEENKNLMDVYQRSLALDSLLARGILSGDGNVHGQQLFHDLSVKTKIVPLLIDLEPIKLLDDEKVLQAHFLAATKAKQVLFETTKNDLFKLGVDQKQLDQIEIKADNPFEDLLIQQNEKIAKQLKVSSERIVSDLITNRISNRAYSFSDYNASMNMLVAFGLQNRADLANADLHRSCNHTAFLQTANDTLKTRTEPSLEDVIEEHHYKIVEKFQAGTRPANLAYLEVFASHLKR
jgi:hypothetical protein